MARTRKVYKNSLSGGQVDEEYRHLTEGALIAAACKTLTNAWLRPGGMARTRPRTTYRAKVPAVGSPNAGSEGVVVWTVRLAGGLVRHLAFYQVSSPSVQGRVTIFDESFAVEATVSSGTTWSASTVSDLDLLKIKASGSEVFVFTGAALPCVLTRATAGTWAASNLSSNGGGGYYDTGIDGQVLQPYYKFPSTRGISITPSDYTGSITLTASADYFDATQDDSGSNKIRLLGRELTITTVTNATTATATVVNRLLPVYDVQVASTTGYEVGGLVEGSETGYQGEVVEVTDATHVKVQMLDTLDNFDTSTPENLIGVRHVSAVAASVVDATPVAVFDWEEPLFSARRGWQTCGEFHRQRLHMAGPTPGLVAASAPNAYRNFDVGFGDDDDAIVEFLGNNLSAEVVDFVSHDDLIVLTDEGPYYAAESSSGAEIYGPSTVFFKKISSEPCSTVPPLYLKEGVVYVSAGSPHLHIVRPNGTDYSRWSTEHLAELSQSIITAPIRLALIDGVGTETQRALLVVNTDGTAAAGFFSDLSGEPLLGFSPWTSASGIFWRSADHYNNQAVAILRCPDGSGGYRWRLCELAFTAGPADAVADYSSAQTPYEAETVDLYGSNGLVSIAGGTINSSGKFVKDAATTEPASGLTIGYTSTFNVTPVPPIDPDTGAQATGAADVRIKLIDTQKISINGYDALGSATAASRYESSSLSGTGQDEPPDLAITSSDNSVVKVAAITYVLRE